MLSGNRKFNLRLYPYRSRIRLDSVFAENCWILIGRCSIYVLEPSSGPCGNREASCSAGIAFLFETSTTHS